MSPLREYRSVSKRYEEDVEVEVLKRYYLIFEGRNTERKYFQGIQGDRKNLGISSLIELVVLNKEGKISSYSAPSKLIELINNKKKELIGNDDYDEEVDKFIVMFDRDSFHLHDDYLEFLQKNNVKNTLIVTSPCFEIWLILHFENAYERFLKPKEKAIIENKKISNTHSYISRIVSELLHANPKKNINFDKIKENIDLAINAEKLIEQKNINMFSKLGSNVGVLIKEMKSDPRDRILNNK